MSISNGPVKTLPGTVHKSTSATCDFCDEPSVCSIQGETDSFGAEYNDVCATHKAEFAESKIEGMCDFCKKEDDDLCVTRDPDEGQAGPVYYVCGPCITKQREAIAKELAQEDYGEYEEEYYEDGGYEEWLDECNEEELK
jgi:hypothetical protein